MKFLKELLWTDDIPTAIDIIAYTFLRHLVFILITYLNNFCLNFQKPFRYIF